MTDAKRVLDSLDNDFAVPDLLAEVDQLRAENARLRAALAAAPRWVPVSEPPQNKTKPWEHIIARCNNGALISAVYDGEQWLEFDHELQEWIPLVNATHWYQVPVMEVTP